MQLHLVAVECLPILPDREDCEMIRTGSGLLKDVISNAAVVFAAVFGRTFQHNFCLVFARRRHIDMCHDGYGVAADHPGTSVDRKALMHALIIRTVVNGLERGTKLSSVLGLFMRVERPLIAPKLDDHEAIWPSDLLDNIDACSSLLRTSNFAIALDQSGSLGGRLQLNIDIRRDIKHGVIPLRGSARLKRDQQETYEPFHLRFNIAQGCCRHTLPTETG